MRLFPLLLLCILSLACLNESTAPLPTDHIFGRYLLRSMNGEAPPQVFTDSPALTLEIVRGVLTLHEDSTFADSTELRRTEKGQTRRVMDVAEGRFQLVGDTLRLHSTRGERYTMLFTTRTLTQQLGHSTLVYRK